MPDINKMMQDVKVLSSTIDDRVKKFRDLIKKANKEEGPNFSAEEQNLLSFSDDLAETIKLLDKEFLAHLPQAIRQELESMLSISQAPTTDPVAPLAAKPSQPEVSTTAPGGGMAGM